MMAAQTAQVRVETHGRVPDGSAELAQARVGPLLRAPSEPVLSARVTLAVAGDPLRVRLGRAARNWAARCGTVPAAGPGEWRHQAIPAHRPAYFPRPAGQPFTFFADAGTGRGNVVYHRYDGHYGLLVPSGVRH